MKVKALLIVACGSLGLSQNASAASWNLDPAHSQIGFSVRHLGLSNVKGRFDRFVADVDADARSGRLSRVEATAEATSINTDNEKRDAHLRSDDFFDAAHHPVLKLAANAFEWKGDEFEVVAELTIRGVTRKVTFEGERLGVHDVDFGGGMQTRAGYHAEATISRKAFGLKFNKLVEGVAIVGDQVRLVLEVQVSRKHD